LTEHEDLGFTLAVDTATGITVGLAKGGQPLAARSVTDSRSHAELTQSLVDEVLAEAGLQPADLDRVAVGLGPGPFTGLRVGIVTGTVLAALCDLPVRGVCTLDALAACWLAAHDFEDEFVVITDARRHEVYWAKYDQSGRVSAPQVSAPDAVPALATIGPGIAAYPEIFETRALPDAQQPLAGAVFAALAWRLPDEGLEPIYLRKPDATEPTTRKSTLTSRRVRLPKP